MLTPGKRINTKNLPHVELRMGNTILEKVDNIKYLGVMLDESFNWSAHIREIKSKIASAVGIISKLRYYVDTNILIQVYHALIASRFHYAITSWGGATKTVLKPISVLQNRAIRLISRTSRYTNLDNAYLNLRLLKFEDIYKLKLAEFIHDFHQDSLPPFFSNYFQNVRATHSHPTRYAAANHFLPIRCNKSIGQRSIRYRAPTHWNELPKISNL